jgi:maleylacetate reductase
MSNYQDAFAFRFAPGRIRFGSGAIASLPAEIEAIDCRRALVLSTPHQSGAAKRVAEILGSCAVGVYSKATMHTPVDVTEDAIGYLKQVNADCTVAIGGGSTTGLGKAIAWRTDLPQIVVPTTYAGSEMTPILGQTEGGRKTTLTDVRVQPEVVVYDPDLTLGLPLGMTVASALNAMAHAAEALYARDRNPVSTLLAIEGLRAFVSSLPLIAENPANRMARGEALYGAWLCGTVLGQVGMALHHKLCHTLGGSFGLPHAETHAIILPHAIAYNGAAVPELLAPLRDLFGAQSAGHGLYDFARKIGAPVALKDLGFKESDLDRAAQIATENPYWNPQNVTREGIRTLLYNAWSGQPPVTE